MAPLVTSIVLSSPQKVNITWNFIPNDIEVFNSYILNGYKVQITPMFPSHVLPECQNIFGVFETTDSLFNVLVDCNYIQLFNLSITSYNHRGESQPNVYCYALGRTGILYYKSINNVFNCICTNNNNTFILDFPEIHV